MGGLSLKIKITTQNNMPASRTKRTEQRGFLGIECGGTKTSSAFSHDGEAISLLPTGPAANLRLTSDKALIRLFSFVKSHCPAPESIGIGMAGALTASDRDRCTRLAQTVWKESTIHTHHDLATAWLAALAITKSPTSTISVIAGTGSCAYTMAADGTDLKSGGWGHVVGDRGSGYAIGLKGLQTVFQAYDQQGKWPQLGSAILSSLQLNSPTELTAWSLKAEKREVASLAPTVFDRSKQRDPMARSVIHEAAEHLASDAIATANKLRRQDTSPREPLCFVFSGSILEKQPMMGRLVTKLVKHRFPKASFKTNKGPTVAGAIALAKQAPSPPQARVNSSSRPLIMGQTEKKHLSPTERRHPASMHLDKMALSDAIQLMAREDQKLPGAILKEAAKIEKLIRWITKSFRAGGKLFYAGAGTSGRLGILDASECPPTFRTPPEKVQGIIAGGQSAIWAPLEGAEDSRQSGRDAVSFRGMRANDVLVGIAASGTTPFVLGAISKAKLLGAKTALICFNPEVQIATKERPHCLIAPAIGPEILTGSTRLKSGTATKMILNMLTTLSMVQIGKVRQNLMVDVHPSNSKLRERAVRIVQQLTEVSRDEAEKALVRHHWQVARTYEALTQR